MPGRNYTLQNYRYGFNGKENDNEVKGAGNQQDYGMRIYDPRLGKFLSVDPLAKKYPELTPYQFASNRPIDGVDLDGREFDQFMMRKIVELLGVSALKVATAADGYGPVVNATYNLQVKTNKTSFESLKKAYSVDPGIIHNPDNSWAKYEPMENTKDNDKYLAKGDHMKIDIMGGVFVDYVRFTDVKIQDNSFTIKAATLFGHTDAGTIEFSGSFDPEIGILDFKINNITTNNVGSDLIGFGRMAQTSQWNQVLTNVQNFLSGEVLSKTLHKEIYNQEAKSGDAKKVVDQDLQTGTCSESYEKCD